MRRLWRALMDYFGLIRNFRTLSHTYAQSRFLLLLLLLLSIPKRILASVLRHFFSRHLGVFGHFRQHLHNEEQIQISEFRIPSLVSNERILLQHSEQEQDSEQEQEHTKRVRSIRISQKLAVGIHWHASRKNMRNKTCRFRIIEAFCRK